MCFRNSVYQYWGHQRKGGVSSSGCGFIFPEDCIAHADLCQGKARLGKTFPASTSDPLAPVNPLHSPFTLLAWLHSRNCWHSTLLHTSSACQHINCLQNLCNAWIIVLQGGFSGFRRVSDILYQRHLSWVPLDYGSSIDRISLQLASYFSAPVWTNQQEWLSPC